MLNIGSCIAIQFLGTSGTAPDVVELTTDNDVLTVDSTLISVDSTIQ